MSGAYKCRGKFGKKLKATEMDDNNFSLAQLVRKFSDLCGEPVGIQYKGKTLVSDNDVKTALEDCYASKKLFLEVDLVGGGGGASHQAAETPVVAAAPRQAAAAAAAPRQTAAPAPVSSGPAPDQVASQMLSKYGLSSPRESAPAAAAATSPRQHVTAAAPAPAPAHARQAQPQQATRVTSPRAVEASNLRGGIEAEVRAEINRLRSNPASFVSALEARKQGFEGNVLRVKRGNVMFRSQTHEGAAAVTQAIQFVRDARPVNKVEFSYGLGEAARDIIEFMGGPDGTRKPTPDDMANMIDRRGQYEGTLSQVIAYVYEDDVVATVLDLLVCDGDASRHTAGLLLNPEYRFAGVAVSASSGNNGPRLLVLQFVSESWQDK